MTDRFVVRKIPKSRLGEVYFLRYVVLVEQQHWNLRDADAHRRVVRDDYDDLATHFGAFLEPDDELFACVRTCIWDELPAGLRDARTGMPKSLAAMIQRTNGKLSNLTRQRCSYTSRFLVEPDIRPGQKPVPKSPQVTLKLFLDLYKWGLANHVEVDWIICLPDDERTYAGFGYQVYEQGCLDPDFPDGDEKAVSTVMYLMLNDERTAFVKHLRRHG